MQFLGLVTRFLPLVIALSVWGCGSSEQLFAPANVEKPTGDAGAPNAPCDTSQSAWQELADGSPVAAVDTSVLPAMLRVYSSTEAHYHAFPSFGEARTWANAFLPSALGKHGADAPTVLPQEDARYAKLAPYFDKLWAAYGELYPAEILKTPKPYLLVVNDTSVNAFAAPYDTSSQQIAGAFVVFQGLVDTIDAKQAAAVIAHELAHYVMRHVVGNVRAAVRKYYFVNGTTEPLGFEQPGDSRAEAVLAQTIDRLVFVGAMSSGFGKYSLGASRTVASSVTSQLAMSTGHASCQSALDLLASPTDLQGLYDHYTLEFKDGVAPPPSVALFETKFVACGTAQGSSVSSGLAAFGNDAVARATATNSVTGAQNGFDAFLRTVNATREALRTSPDAARVRYYTEEEQADDLGIMAAARAGVAPQSFVNMILTLAPLAGGGADYSTRCQADLDANRTPPYWIEDPHHSFCYRAHHFTRYATRALKSESCSK